jgi:hypothetical protein
MHRILVAAVVLGLAAPQAASAGPLVEGSIGAGLQLTPSVERSPVNVMVAPGWSLLDGILKLELGLAGSLGDIQQAKFDLELRPMVVISPPILPFYVRAVFAVQNLVNGPLTAAYGGALGFSFSLLGIGLFAEAGVLPRNVKVDTVTGRTYVGSTTNPTREEFRWFGEGRLGVTIPL